MQYSDGSREGSSVQEDIVSSIEYFTEEASTNLEVLKDIFESNIILSESFLQNLIEDKNMVSIKPF